MGAGEGCLSAGHVLYLDAHLKGVADRRVTRLMRLIRNIRVSKVARFIC